MSGNKLSSATRANIARQGVLRAGDGAIPISQERGTIRASQNF